MSDDYTPDTDEVRESFYVHAYSRDMEHLRAAAFDRWLTAHDTEIRTAALEEAAEIAEEARASAAMQLRETDFPDSQYSQWVSGKCDMAAAIEITIRAAQKGTP